MNKKFLALMTGALMFSGVGTFVACSDYDDDIDGLSNRLDKVEAAVAELQKSIDAGAVITDVEPTANGVKVTLSNGKTFELTNGTNGTNGKDGSVVEIGEDGFWYVDGVKTSYPAQGPKGDKGEPGKDGANGQNGKNGNYYEPGLEGEANGFWVLVDGTTGEKTVTDKRWAPTDGNVVVAVWTKDRLVIKGAKNHEGDIVVALTTDLKSMVFIPEFYYQGIEAMPAHSLVYKDKLKNKVDANGDYYNDAPRNSSEDSIRTTPKLQATYHLNPANATMPEDIAMYTFANTVDDKHYVRSYDDVVVPTVYDKEIKNGDLTVWANLKKGAVKLIGKDGKVTVLALEVATEDTVITSDYAALKPYYKRNFALANAKDPALHNQHWSRTAKDAIEGLPNENGIVPDTIAVPWNQTVDIATYVQTHFQKDENPGVCFEWDKNALSTNVNKEGCKYYYELVGYKLGANKTSESAHAALKGSVLRPQMTVDGKQQGYEMSEQSKATIGRKPLVRVTLRDTISGKNLDVRYVKVHIIPSKVIDTVTEIAPFINTTSYTTVCPLQELDWKLQWFEVEERIIDSLKLSKAEFEASYKPEVRVVDDYDSNHDQLLQFNGVVASSRPLAAISYVGKIYLTKMDKDVTETNVLNWKIDGDEAYEIFAKDRKKSVSVIVRFTKTEVFTDGGIDQTRHHYVYVTLKWIPKDINVDPAGEIEENDKIAEHWYTAWTGNHGGFDEVHNNNDITLADVADASACTYSTNMLNVFTAEKKLFISKIAPIYKGYEDKNLKKFFDFDESNKNVSVEGLSKAKYTLNIKPMELVAVSTPENIIKGNLVLTATKGGKTQDIAVISGAVAGEKNYTTTSTFDDDKIMITYLETDFAKDILNKNGHLDLKQNETFTAKIKISTLNKCNKPLVKLVNDTYNVRFLRPINLEAHSAEMVDAHNEGSWISLDSCLVFTDWRSNHPMSKFSEHPNYYRFYGVDSIYVGSISSSTLALNTAHESGIKGGLKLNDYVTTTLNGNNFNKTLGQVTQKMELDYFPAAASEFKDGNMGQIVYYNNGENVNKDFQVSVPIIAKYKWGYVQDNLIITIKKTLGN